MLVTVGLQTLQRLPYIQYPVKFRGDKLNVLINFGNKDNAMTSIYVTQIVFAVKFIEIGAQKINSYPLKTYEIVSARFSFQDKEDKDWFFKKTFLLANISIEVILSMTFFTLSNVDINFETRGLTWKSFISADTLSTMSRIQPINKHNFAHTALDEKSGIFMLHVAAPNVIEMAIH